MNFYLSDMGEEREREAIRRFFFGSSNPLIGADWKDLTGIEIPWTLIGFRIPYDYINPDLKEKEGDIDLFFARLQPNFNSSSQSIIDWSYLVGLEVKAAYFNKNDQLKYAGLISVYEETIRVANKQRKARNQVERIFESGFNKVGLLHILSTEPRNCYSQGIQSWFFASDVRKKAEEMIIPQIHTEDDDPYGTLLLTMGAVPEKLENDSGAWGGIEIIKEMKNHSNEKDFTQKLQKETEKAIQNYAGEISWPILMVACSNKKSCRTVYITTAHSFGDCPVCGSPSR